MSSADLCSFRRLSARREFPRTGALSPAAGFVRYGGMPNDISARLLAIVDALPLTPGLRVLEIGCGPGAMAREMARRIGSGHVLAIDRSAKAIGQLVATSGAAIAEGRLSARQATAEEFVLEASEPPFDLAVAVRVGALDGRHPEAGELAKRRIAAALTPRGRLFIDGGDPLRELPLAAYRS